MRKTLTLVLSFLLAAACQAQDLGDCLSRTGISAADSARFQTLADLSAQSFQTNKNRLLANQPIPPEVDEVFQSLGVLNRKYQLSGEQTLGLLASLMQTFNPRAQSLTPVFQQMGATMKEHNVPGADLYDFLTPSLQQSLRYRLSADKSARPAMTMRKLMEAQQFAKRYGLPVSKLTQDLQTLRNFMDKQSQLDP